MVDDPLEPFPPPHCGDFFWPEPNYSLVEYKASEVEVLAPLGSRASASIGFVTSTLGSGVVFLRPFGPSGVAVPSAFRSLPRLHHPCIVRTFGHVTASGRTWLLQEFCPLGSLNDWLRPSSTSELPPAAGAAALRALAAAAAALRRAHSAAPPRRHGQVRPQAVALAGAADAPVAKLDFAAALVARNGRKDGKDDGNDHDVGNGNDVGKDDDDEEDRERRYAPPAELGGSALTDVYQFGVMMWEVLHRAAGARAEFPAVDARVELALAAEIARCLDARALLDGAVSMDGVLQALKGVLEAKHGVVIESEF